MNNIAIYTLTSPLHDEQSVDSVTTSFLQSLGIEYDFCGNDFSDYGERPLNLLFIRTGGSENLFLQQLPLLLEKTESPIYLLTSGKSNSLAASMEILSYLRLRNIKGEILHGAPFYISARINELVKTAVARKKMSGTRLGIIGNPSDWLISSIYDKDVIRQKLGIDLIEISMSELLEAYEVVSSSLTEEWEQKATDERVCHSVSGALRIYEALKNLVYKYRLDGFTIRCFDLLTSVHNTGCVALAKLNSEGIVAGCEGDVPALLSMFIAKAITGRSSFQANPAYIDANQGQILFAHCTIPLDMVARYELDTHFESGIGVGIRGFMEPGDVTVWKVAGNLSRSFVAEGKLVRNQQEPDLCRTQQVIQLAQPEQASYFLNNPIGNHHIIMAGHHASSLKDLLADLNID